MSAADRELLELAAKAYGIKLRYNYLGFRDANQPWDPLTDDGDALRLAVALRMLVGPGSAMAPRFDVIFADGDDVAAATRRAIVLAAAAIVVKTADIDPALLRDMLATSPPTPLLPAPAEPTPEAVAAAVAAEREACAWLAETEWSTDGEKAYGDELAAAIRARGAS